jgi:hypothetical protein
MKKGQKGKPGFVPQLTLGKIIRLAVFAVLTATGFILSHHGHMSSFGWGYTFGLIGMAILIG